MCSGHCFKPLRTVTVGARARPAPSSFSPTSFVFWSISTFLQEILALAEVVVNWPLTPSLFHFFFVLETPCIGSDLLPVQKPDSTGSFYRYRMFCCMD